MLRSSKCIYITVTGKSEAGLAKCLNVL